MSLTLADISVEREELTVRIPSLKKDVRMKAIPFAEVLQIRAALVKPQPPLKPNPRKGHLAPPEPDLHDPVYAAEFNDYIRAVHLAIIARSLGYTPALESSSPAHRFGGENMAAWVNAVEEEFGSVLTEDDVLALNRAYARVSGEADADDGGELDPKASSSLPAARAAMGMRETPRSPSAGSPASNPDRNSPTAIASPGST